MQTLPSGYFDIPQPLPSLRKLQAGHLTCCYENGQLRYIRLGCYEIVRMIYVAVRDQHWLTATCRIDNEQIHETDTGFVITYTGLHELNDIMYQTQVRIEGADNCISYQINGEALSNFLRNRIGICVHHPIPTFAGKKIHVTKPNGNWYKFVCPVMVNPHQPLLSIQQMSWIPTNDVEATLTFEGEVFETEDQRNWTDASFKTYSTPLIRPIPVAVAKGERIAQSVTLQIREIVNIPSATIPVEIILSDQTYPFPKIGYGRSDQPLSSTDINFLKEIPFHHYRVEIRFSEDWKPSLQAAIAEARQLQVLLELVCFFGENAVQEAEALVSFTQTNPDWNVNESIDSLLILSAHHSTSPIALLENVTYALRNFLPKNRMGAGTDHFFAELNRTRFFTEDVGFLSYPITPQVHLSDIRTLIENLEAQQHSVETALSFAGGKSIHVSPVTMRIRHYPEPNTYTGSLPSNVDPRQCTTFAAAWTLLSLRYLAQAQQITYYETIGMRGIMQGSQSPPDPALFAAEAGDVFPMYEFLKTIKQFQPACIIRSIATYPLQVDALVLENSYGQRLAFAINFCNHHQSVLLGNQSLMLPPASITQIDL